MVTASSNTFWGILRGPSANEGKEKGVSRGVSYNFLSYSTKKLGTFCSPEIQTPPPSPLPTVRDFFQILKSGLNRSLNLNYLSVQSSALSWKLELITLLAFLHLFWFILAVTGEHADGITAAFPTFIGAASSHAFQMATLETPPNPFFFTEFRSKFLCYETHCKIFMALSTKFCLWPCFLLSRELLRQCLGFFSCILIGKGEELRVLFTRDLSLISSLFIAYFRILTINIEENTITVWLWDEYKTWSERCVWTGFC